MNADTQNRELFRWLTEQEARSVIEEMKTSPSFTQKLFQQLGAWLLHMILAVV